MTEILSRGPGELNIRQRWASYLTILVAVAGLIGAVGLRSQIEGATALYENKKAGISAEYPADWLFEQEQAGFLFRAQDPAAVPFKTSLQIEILTVGPEASPSEVLNLLNMDRAAQLAAYRQLDTVPIFAPNILSDQPPVQMRYAFVENEPNPFLQAVPIVVEGIDVVILRNSQAIIVTYRADSGSFERNRAFFDNFFGSLKIS